VRPVRAASALLAAAVLALGASGCGGDATVTPEVPGDPVSVPIPSNPDSLGDSSGASADDTGADATPTPTPDAGTAAPEDQSGAAPAAGTDTTAGTAPVVPPEDGPQTDTAPPAGSDAEEFEDFCAQNPGAC